ncbi:2OG-Fe dioxygenase family protein [Actinacidiphila glaucinigra]|uniref:2OG-Fe dioxygenase family protein n=1 Tax=Actinacidiphila glaucinigra TaxID=235986 RepID=UPI002DD8A955|nr:2OG-Fe dioxygenase family protein [Actinacidiphila glaucinigra]WSD65672.1 2OG-Fe dioxygenase family protein [Actinacidiphila glaucinigra]
MSEKTATPGPSAATASADLVEQGWHLQSSDTVSRLLGVGDAEWAAYADHWDDLVLDTYMKDGGTYRNRRYGHFRLDVDGLRQLPHAPYRQESAVNPLNGGIDRHFEPLTDAFLANPLTSEVVRMLGEIFSAAEGIGAWDVKLHPFRIITGADQVGKPAPQGRHRDGSTFVTSLLVRRNNVEGGESSLHGDDDTLLLRSTLSRPGDQLLVDDRRLLHDVTPLRAVDPALPAYRDVLIVDFDRLSA